MFTPQVALPTGLLGVALGLLLFIPAGALGHCDTMNGPVVGEARKALAAGDVTPVLKWVKPDAEADVTAVFRQTLAVRSKGSDARELADRHFFETLVRIHRAGEGAPFTGLRDEPVEPVVARADAALVSGSVDDLADLLAAALAEGIRARFERVRARAGDKDRSVELGREYVEAYVEFTHYVERLHADIESGAGHGHPEGEGEPPTHGQ